jgi:hypothetical protein
VTNYFSFLFSLKKKKEKKKKAEPLFHHLAIGRGSEGMSVRGLKRFRFPIVAKAFEMIFHRRSFASFIGGVAIPDGR